MQRVEEYLQNVYNKVHLLLFQIQPLCSRKADFTYNVSEPRIVGHLIANAKRGYNREILNSLTALQLSRQSHCIQARKRNPNLNFFGPDIFQRGGGLPREGVGAERFGMSPETRETKLFWAGYPVILPGYPGGARKV